MASNLPDDFDHRAFEARFGSDSVADSLSRATIVHALAKLAYFIGEDTIGDAAQDALHDAMRDDGIDHDDYEHAESVLDDEHRKASNALATLSAEVARLVRAAAARDAKALAAQVAA